MNLEMLDLYTYYVNEREKVQRRREAGNLAPWTMDTVLRNYHFCHNRREDDRGTKEIRAFVQRTEPNLDFLPAAYTMARLFNRVETLEYWFDHGCDFDAIQFLYDTENKVFNTAYVVSTCGKSMGKVEYVRRVCDEVLNTEVPRTSCRAAFDALRTVDGLGSFLAGQVVADLKNDRYLVEAPDWHTFSVMGPGSKKGLDFIFGPGTTERNYEDRISSLEVLTSGTIPKLHRQDMQNTLCEFSKYVRYRNDLPGRRRKYNAS